MTVFASGCAIASWSRWGVLLCAAWSFCWPTVLAQDAPKAGDAKESPAAVASERTDQDTEAPRRNDAARNSAADSNQAKPDDAPEEVFSGPQPGERLTPFTMRLAVGRDAGKDFDIVTSADGGPLVIIFIHEVTRPSMGLARTISQFAHRRHADGLRVAMVLLTPDPTETHTWARRAQNALPAEVPVGVSHEGLEGPGAYGLNRNVAMTVLVGKEGKATANFALVQPSINVDAPKIGRAIEAVLGRDHQPTLEEMGVDASGRPMAMDDDRFRELLGPVIRRGASDEQVQAAAAKVDEAAAENEAFRRRLGEAAQRIVESGRIDNYGTPAAREHLRRWAEKFGREGASAER